VENEHSIPPRFDPVTSAGRITAALASDLEKRARCASFDEHFLCTWSRLTELNRHQSTDRWRDRLTVAKRIRIGLIALASVTFAAGSPSQAQSADSRVMINTEGVEVLTEAFEQELSCIYETAGWDATMNFAESAYNRQNTATLRDSIAEAIADCALQHNWDAETQTLAFNTYLYASLMDYCIELTGSWQFDGETIFGIWNELSNDDKAALAAEDAAKNDALLARTVDLIRRRTQNASDESVAYALDALAATTVYLSFRYEWSQKAVGN